MALTRLISQPCGLATAFLTFALLLPGIGAQAQPDDVLVQDFRAALEQLEAANESLLAARSALEQSRAERGEADARRWPTVEISGRYTHMDGPLEADVSPVTDLLEAGLGQIGVTLPPGLIPSEFRIQDRNFFNLSLQAVQPLYLGGRIQAGRAAAGHGFKASEAALERQRAELTVTLVERFYGQVLARENLDLRKRSLDNLRKHDYNARRLEEEGQIARVERLRAGVAVAEAEGERVVAEEQLRLASAALAALLASDRPVSARGAIPPPPAELDRAVWQSLARDNNPALKEARQRLAQARAGARAARGESHPVVALFGARELYTDDLTLIEPEWAVGIQASWTLFDGGQRRARTGRAEALVDEIAWRLASGERNVSLLVDQQFDQLTGALARQQTYAATAELAEEALIAQQRAFEEGLGTSLEVVEAELARSRVTLAELAARRDAWVAVAGLYAAAGKIDQLVTRIEGQSSD